VVRNLDLDVVRSFVPGRMIVAAAPIGCCRRTWELQERPSPAVAEGGIDPEVGLADSSGHVDLVVHSQKELESLRTGEGTGCRGQTF